MKEIGCIIIPKNVNREEFINFCFSKEKFWVMTNKRGMLSNVSCLHQVIKDIEFPENNNSLGSQVFIEYIEEYNLYLIVGTVSKINESFYYNEETLFDYKTYQGTKDEAFGNTIGMIGNSLLSKLVIFAKNLYKKTSELLIECLGNKESILSLKSSGWIFLKSENGLKLRNQKKEISILEDKILLSLSSEQVLILKDKELIYEDGVNKFKIDESGYNLGNINFKDYITEILNFLGNNLILLTPCGPTSAGCNSSPSSVQLNQLKTKIDQINKK